MTDFEYDVRQRAILARSARYRKGTVKGPKKCTLPSDRLTQAQLKKLNGEVENYMLNAPISWEKFKSYPDEVKRKYILGLRETHSATNADLARMFGVNLSTISLYTKSLGISPKHRGGSSAQHRAEWQAWLDEWRQPSVVSEPGGHTVDSECPTPTNTPTVEHTNGLKATSISLTYRGKFILADFASALANLPIPDGEVCVFVSIAARKED